MATCNRCGRELNLQEDEIVIDGGSSTYCSPCAYSLYAQQQSPDLVRAGLFGILSALLGLGVWGILSFLLAYLSGGVLLLFMGFPASFIGLVVGMGVYRGSGRKRGKALRWLSGIITGITLIIACFIIGLALNTMGISPAISLIVAVTSFFPGIYGALKLVSQPCLLVSTPEHQKFQPFQPSVISAPAEQENDESLQVPLGGVTSPWSVFGNMVLISIILMILASILFPMFAKAREKARCAGCSSNVRQLALAIEMYAQEHDSQYPGIDDSSWVSKIAPYLGSSSAMFVCPDDNTADNGTVSYAMNGLLIGPEGKGIKESQVISPSEVGSIADATPSIAYPNGRLIDGAPLGDFEITGAAIDTRRNKNGTIVGFCDGHAKYFQGRINKRDIGNGAVRAFYHVSPLGLIDNPVAGMPDFTTGRTISDRVEIGGEFCTNTILRAAAKAWEVKTKAPWHSYGFTGQYASGKRSADYLWGTGDGRKPAGNAIPIARDAVVVIVAKGSKISCLPQMRNSSYEVDYPTLRQLFGAGYAKESVQVYTFGANSGTQRYLADRLGTDGKPLKFRMDAVTVANDQEMVEKVCNDPWGIGYCSSAMADEDRVVIFALKTPSGRVFYYPQRSTKHRWLVPDSPNWPWMRTLYAEYGGAAWQADGSGMANVMLAPGGAGTAALRKGPLFGTGLWRAE